jgi:hypothetical protein
VQRAAVLDHAAQALACEADEGLVLAGQEAEELRHRVDYRCALGCCYVAVDRQAASSLLERNEYVCSVPGECEAVRAINKVMQCCPEVHLHFVGFRQCNGKSLMWTC